MDIRLATGLAPLLLGVAVIAGCGSDGTATPFHTITVHPTHMRATTPQTDDRAVLTEVDHYGGYPHDDTAVANFAAVGEGNAHITSYSDVGCLHGSPPCLPPQRGFSVTVLVR